MLEEYQDLMKIMEKKGYPLSVQETAVGTIVFAENKELTEEKVLALLRQNLTAREMVKALQPIIKEA